MLKRAPGRRSVAVVACPNAHGEVGYASSSPATCVVTPRVDRLGAGEVANYKAPAREIVDAFP